MSRTWPRPRWEIWELSSLKHHSLTLGPILRKSAIVPFAQQFKMIDSNNSYCTVLNVLFPK